jgi:hypothetical protein
MRVLPEPVGSKNSTSQFFPGGTTWLAGEEVPMMLSFIAASWGFELLVTLRLELVRRLAAGDIDPLVGFVDRKVGSRRMVVVNVLPVGASTHEQKAGRNVIRIVSVIAVPFCCGYCESSS